MKTDILEWPRDEKALRRPASAVMRFDRVDWIIDRLMLAITFSKRPARGLAAPQIGIPLQVVAIVNAPIFYMFNPTILETSKRTVMETEECLSVPGAKVDVRRPVWVRVSWFHQSGVPQEKKFTGRLARVVQHEIDHLHGKLILDYLYQTAS